MVHWAESRMAYTEKHRKLSTNGILLWRNTPDVFKLVFFKDSWFLEFSMHVKYILFHLVWYNHRSVRSCDSTIKS